jgi:dTDP-4-amino-4,6-dideoxygalactose transaminase
MKTTWPRFADDEIRAVARVLRSGRVNQWTGEEVSKFEEEFRKFVGAKYAVAFANGSLALEAAFASLDLRPGSEVVVPARTFVATAMSVVRAGLTPVFADVGEDGLSRAPHLEAAVTGRTGAVCVVHLGGKAVDQAVCGVGLRGLPTVEDCAQALGARYPFARGGDGLPPRVGTQGRIGAYSFCQDKHMTTGGEGGMLVCDDYMLYRKLWAWKDHGKVYEKATSTVMLGGYKWCHSEIGTNARMTEMQAAIGRVQLKRVPGWVARRRELANRLHNRLSDIRGLRTVPIDEGESHYRYYAYAEELQESWPLDRVIANLINRGVQCGQGVCPEVYREQAFYNGLRFCHTARALGMTSIMFKLDPTMTNRYIDGVARHVKDVMKKARYMEAKCTRWA